MPSSPIACDLGMGASGSDRLMESEILEIVHSSFKSDPLQDEPGFINHNCNTLDDLKEMNCKRFSTEKSE